jgi:hypothetical protein
MYRGMFDDLADVIKLLMWIAGAGVLAIAGWIVYGLWYWLH